MSNTVATAIPTGTWNVDPSHSSVEFQVKHMGIATVKGQFGTFEGSVAVADDGAVTVTGSVDVASIDTREEQRDAHLKSDDFFDADNHPKITFASTEITPVDDETLKVTGDITIRGVTKPITLDVAVEGADQDPWGNDRVALSATGTLKRSEFGMTFNQALGSGNMLVSDKVKIAVDVSAVKAA